MSTAEANATAEILERIADRYRTLRREIGRVYIGPEAALETLMIALLARGHVLIEGVPGIAKTTLVKAFAQTLDCSFRRIQFTPDLLPSDITGTYIFDRRSERFELREGPLFANVVLGDEINRAPAKTQSALLEAMQESQVTIEGTTRRLPEPFLVLATQNPIEQEGVYLLPEAQVDRFLLKLEMGYPSLEDELRVLQTHAHSVPDLEPVLGPDDLLAFARATEDVLVRTELAEYIVRLVRATRELRTVLVGASPRSALALMRSARARAALQGREHVLPDDIKALAPSVLAHRIVLLPETELSGTTRAAVVSQVLESVRYSLRS